MRRSRRGARADRGDAEARFPAAERPDCRELPYYITSPILERVFNPGTWERAVFLVQAEVAERIAAGPGTRDFGYLSVLVQTHLAEILFPVGREAFVRSRRWIARWCD
jgi:hypothetical protein